MQRPVAHRPVDHAEQTIVTAILEGRFPPGSILPAERELAALLGVTRPTLREALRRLERDGWLVVHQGKSTAVTDFWTEGGMNVLSGIVRYSQHLPPDFVPNLLQVRLDLAPTYTRLAVERAPAQTLDALAGHDRLAESPAAFAAFDWTLQKTLAVAAGNPIYALILNSFASFYHQLAVLYFSHAESRVSSRAYYTTLAAAARQGDSAAAEEATRAVMRESMRLWQRAGSPVEAV